MRISTHVYKLVMATLLGLVAAGETNSASGQNQPAPAPNPVKPRHQRRGQLHPFHASVAKARKNTTKELKLPDKPPPLKEGDTLN